MSELSEDEQVKHALQLSAAESRRAGGPRLSAAECVRAVLGSGVEPSARFKREVVTQIAVFMPRELVKPRTTHKKQLLLQIKFKEKKNGSWQRLQGRALHRRNKTNF